MKLFHLSRWRVRWAVARVTLQEILMDRILYNGILLSVFLFALARLVSELNVFRPERVMIDFGLAAVSWSSSIMGVLLGATVLIRELDKRTIYLALSRPIWRSDFLIGKWIGIFAVLLFNWILLVVADFLILFWMSELGWKVISQALCVSLFFALLQSWVLCSISLFFSVFSTSSLSIMLSIGFYLVGVTHTQLIFIAKELHSAFWRALVYGLAWVLPNFEYFHLGTQVSYGLPVSFDLFLMTVGYGLWVILFFLAFAAWLLKIRQI